MLQIISGKFFDEAGPINNKDCDAVLYANFSWIGPIETAVAELRPVPFSQSDISAFAVRYRTSYQPSPNDILVMPVGGEAIEQFRLLSSFWFKSVFHEDRSHVEHLCRKGPRLSAVSEPVPRQFIPDFFESPKQGAAEHVGRFGEFVQKVLDMPRHKFLPFISCLHLFFNALEALSTNFDLSYSMFVYLLEALSKSDTTYEPDWDDYDQNVRDKLDSILATTNATLADNIRATLLEGAQLKLTHRFINYVTEHLDDSFFTSESVGLARAVARSDISQVLRNLYQTRSGFVHELRKVHKQMSMPNAGTTNDLFTWGHQPFLSMSGVVRVTHHVLMQYVQRQERVPREQYPNWRNELPGIITVEFAPQYWIWKADTFHAREAKKRFNGCVEHLIGQLDKQRISIPDMRDVLIKIEKLFGQASSSDQPAMLALYYLLTQLVAKDKRAPNAERFLQVHSAVSDTCKIEFLAAFVLLGCPIEWPVDECVSVLRKYKRNKYKETAINLPRRLEIAIGAQIANMYLEQEDQTQFNEMMVSLILDAAGLLDVQDSLLKSRKDTSLSDVMSILGWRQSESAPLADAVEDLQGGGFA